MYKKYEILKKARKTKEIDENYSLKIKRQVLTKYAGVVIMCSLV